MRRLRLHSDFWPAVVTLAVFALVSAGGALAIGVTHRGGASFTLDPGNYDTANIVGTDIKCTAELGGKPSVPQVVCGRVNAQNFIKDLTYAAFIGELGDIDVRRQEKDGTLRTVYARKPAARSPASPTKGPCPTPRCVDAGIGSTLEVKGSHLRCLVSNVNVSGGRDTNAKCFVATAKGGPKPGTYGYEINRHALTVLKIDPAGKARIVYAWRQLAS